MTAKRTADTGVAAVGVERCLALRDGEICPGDGDYGIKCRARGFAATLTVAIHQRAKFAMHFVAHSATQAAAQVFGDRGCGCHLVLCVFAEAGQQICLVLGGQCINQFIHITLSDRFNFIQRQVDAVIGNAALRIIVGTDTF